MLIFSELRVDGIAARASHLSQRASGEKVSQMLLYGADVFRVRPDQTADDSTVKMLRMAIERFGWYPCPSFGPFNPYQVEGPKTISFELVEQLDGAVPDWIIVPVGAGCLLAGVWKGFRDFRELGLIERMPRLVGVQPSANPPFVRAFRNSEFHERSASESVQTVADALSDPFPWDGDAAVAALKDTDGLAVEVSDRELLEAERLLASMEGLFASPSGAAGMAGLSRLKDEGAISRKDSVVVLVTDTGFKHMSAAGSLVNDCPVINPILDDLKSIQAT